MKQTLLAILVICSSPVFAETYLFVGTDFPHVLEETSDGSFHGVGADIAKVIVEGLGHKIKIELYPWARAQHMLEVGEADVLIGPYKTEKRSKFMDHTDEHFYTDRIVLYTKVDNPFIWNGDFSSLKGKIIGTTRGWSYGPAFDKIKESLTLEPIKELCTNFKKLMVERVEIVPATQRNALVCIEKLNINDKIKLLTPDIQTTNGYFGFSKKKELAHFKKQFNKKLKEMVENGSVLAINKKYKLRY